MTKLFLKQIHYSEPTASRHQFPFTLPILADVNELVFDTPVTFIVGENGAGKSTLIETIAGLMELNLEGGSRNHLFSSYTENHPLIEVCRAIRYPNHPTDNFFYRAETYYNLMTNVDEVEKWNTSPLFEEGLHFQSRGESLKELIKQRFFGNGFYLMDEPETGLSLNSQLELLVMMQRLVNQDSQFVIATHSPVLLMYPGAKIFELDKEGITEKTFEETKICQDWEMLFLRKELFIQNLLQDM